MSNDTDPEANSDTQSGLTSPQMTWIDAMEEAFDSAVDRQAEIELELDDMDVKVPVQLGDDPNYANWQLSGTVTLRFDGISDPLAEWLRYYTQRKMSPILGHQDESATEDTDTDSE